MNKKAAKSQISNPHISVNSNLPKKFIEKKFVCLFDVFKQYFPCCCILYLYLLYRPCGLRTNTIHTEIAITYQVSKQILIMHNS